MRRAAYGLVLALLTAGCGGPQRGTVEGVVILPYIEQDNVYRVWYSNPTPAAQYNGPTAPAAAVIKTLLAPSDALGTTPYEQAALGVNPAYPNGRYVGLTSYGCNGGTAAPLAFVTDGVFHYSTRTRLTDITDGTSGTILLGERYGFDRNWAALTRTASNDMRAYSAWAGGPFFAWRTTLTEINYWLASAFVAHEPGLRALIARRQDVFGPLGVTPATAPQRVMEAIDRAPRSARWRGFGLVFGYPEHAVEFFVAAGEKQGDVGESRCN